MTMHLSVNVYMSRVEDVRATVDRDGLGTVVLTMGPGSLPGLNGVTVFLNDDQLKMIGQTITEHLGLVMVEPNKGDGE